MQPEHNVVNWLILILAAAAMLGSLVFSLLSA